MKKITNYDFSGKTWTDCQVGHIDNYKKSLNNKNNNFENSKGIKILSKELGEIKNIYSKKGNFNRNSIGKNDKNNNFENSKGIKILSNEFGAIKKIYSKNGDFNRKGTGEEVGKINKVKKSKDIKINAYKKTQKKIYESNHHDLTKKNQNDSLNQGVLSKVSIENTCLNNTSLMNTPIVDLTESIATEKTKKIIMPENASQWDEWYKDLDFEQLMSSYNCNDYENNTKYNHIDWL